MRLSSIFSLALAAVSVVYAAPAQSNTANTTKPVVRLPSLPPF